MHVNSVCSCSQSGPVCDWRCSRKQGSLSHWDSDGRRPCTWPVTTDTRNSTQFRTAVAAARMYICTNCLPPTMANECAHEVAGDADPSDGTVHSARMEKHIRIFWRFRCKFRRLFCKFRSYFDVLWSKKCNAKVAMPSLCSSRTKELAF